MWFCMLEKLVSQKCEANFPIFTTICMVRAGLKEIRDFCQLKPYAIGILFKLKVRSLKETAVICTHLQVTF